MSNLPARKDQSTEKSNTLTRYLEGREGELVKALRGFVDPKHFIRVGVTLYRQGGKGTLIECTPESVMASLFEGAQLGLSPDPHLGEFWLVPRNTNQRYKDSSGKWQDNWVKQATFQVGVQGLKKLAMRSGEVLSIKPVVAYKGDEFSLRLGSDDHRIEHVPNPEAVRNAENLIAVYAVAKLYGKNGSITTQFEHMFRSDVEESADRSGKDGKRGDSWKNHYTSMAQVRVVGRLCKWLPRTDELALALHRDSMREIGIEPDSVVQIESEYVPKPGRRGINQFATGRDEPIEVQQEPMPQHDPETGEVEDENGHPELPDEFA
jgi:recombination protein RecT